MYGGFLYCINYEEYKKKESELDEKIKQLAVENEENEDIVALDEAYIIRVDDEDYRIGDNLYYLLLIGDHHFNADYIEDVLYGNEEAYARYKELNKKELKDMTSDELAEAVHLQSRFIAQTPDDAEVFEEMVYDRNTEYGEMLKQIF